MSINKIQVYLGLSFLLIGISIYLPFSCGFGYSLKKLVFVRNNIPDMIHPLSFILLTCGFLNLKRFKSYLLITSTWFAINIIFEIGQKYHYNINYYFNDFTILNHSIKILNKYFEYGVFDWYDIVAFSIGSIVAIVLLQTTSNERDPKWQKKYSVL